MDPISGHSKEQSPGTGLTAKDLDQLPEWNEETQRLIDAGWDLVEGDAGAVLVSPEGDSQVPAIKLWDIFYLRD